MAYYQLEPFGAIRDNLHSAQIAALIFNSNRGKSQPAIGADKFMYRDAVSAETEKQAGIAARFASFGGRK